MYRKILSVVDNAKALRRVSESFPQFEEWTDHDKSVFVDLNDTFNVVQGLGLSAPQIGILKRAVIINPQRLGLDENIESLIMINPSIELSGPVERGEEACFSVPGVFGQVERQQSCKVTYTSIDGKERVLEANGFPAVCLQHEIDHLDGVLYIDRMGPLSRKMLLKKLMKIEKKKSEAAKLAKLAFDQDHRSFYTAGGEEKKKTTHSKKRKPKARKPRPKRSKKRK